MTDYKELIEELREHCLCITDGCNCGNCDGLLADKAYCRLQIELHKQAADAIEQLARDNNVITRERNAAVADLKFLCKNYNVLNICITCGHCADRGVGCNKETCEYEWRGVQND